MRLLIDEALSPQVARILTEHGHDALHLEDFGLLGSPDKEVMAAADAEQRVLLRRTPHRPEEQAKLLLAVLDEVTPDLEAGAVVRSRDSATSRSPKADKPTAA